MDSMFVASGFVASGFIDSGFASRWHPQIGEAS
jgi:hypothetical protein